MLEKCLLPIEFLFCLEKKKEIGLICFLYFNDQFRPTPACSAWPSILTRDIRYTPNGAPSFTVVRGVAKFHPTFSPFLMELTLTCLQVSER